MTGLALVLLLAVAAVYVFSRLGRSEAIDDARALTRLAGFGIVEPQLSAGVLARDPAALARLDRVVRASVLRGSVVRVKVWTPNGRIVYSDEPRLIGSRYPLGADETHALQAASTEAELSDLARPENRFERRWHKLLEVYVPLHTRNGKPVLYEEYLRYSSVAASGRRIWHDFLPALIAALVLLELAQVPLAWSLARRLRERQREREALLQQAVEAQDTERRRIAADLHDGLVQELAGMAFELAADAERSEGHAADSLRRAASAARATVRPLRAVLVQIYPPTLHAAGLEAALADLLAPAAARGLETRLRVPDDLRLTPEAEELLFRGAQEGLRNVLAHSGATAVEVRVESTDHHVALLVEDNGRGFSEDEVARRRGEGHVGLSLLSGLAENAGGRLVVDGRGEGGARLRLEVPVA